MTTLAPPNADLFSPRTTDGQPFPLLADLPNYQACHWDLAKQPQRRTYWLNLYRGHIAGLLDHAVEVAVDQGQDQADARERAEQCRQAFLQYLQTVEAKPLTYGRLDIYIVGVIRERLLRAHGLPDAYRLLKQRETAAAMKLLPKVLAGLDAMDSATRAARLIEGVFAGNIFDVGAVKTLELIMAGKIDFLATRDELAPRPWLFDDLDAWLAKLAAADRAGRPPYPAAALFVDNAGCDLVLGMIPFARDLLQRGVHVILTANTTPALNDVTHDELGVWLDQIAELDPVIAKALADGSLERIPSGNGAPLIDLSDVSPAINQAVTDRGVDLVVLEGMGRAVESNLDAKLTCDSLKLAMIKDPDVAEGLNGKMYDLVMRFDRGSG